MLAIGDNRVTRFDGGDDIVKQVAFEVRERRCRSEHITFRTIVFLSTAVGHHDDHRFHFTVSNQIVHNRLGLTESLPLGLIPADAVQEIEYGVLLIGRIAGRSVDVHVTAGTDRLRIVLDHLQLAMWNVIADAIETGRRIIEGRFVIGAERDASTAWNPRLSRPGLHSIRRSCWWRVRPRSCLYAFRLSHFLGDITDLAGKGNFILADLAGIGDAQFIAAEVEQFNEVQRIARDLKFLQFHFPPSFTRLHGSPTRECFTINFECEQILLQANACVKIRLPISCHIGTTRG